LYKPIREIIEKRRSLIRQRIEEAEKIKKEAMELKENYQHDINKLHELKSGMIEKMNEEVEQDRKNLMGKAEVEAATNILQEMERYPLVEADLSANYTPSRVVSAMGSVLELYGPKKIISTIFLLVAAFFAYSAYQEYFDEGDAVEVTSVEQGEIFQAITVPCKVVSKLKVNLTPSIAGRLTHVYVEEGDTVKSGDLLARLDDREAKSQLNRAKANFESAKDNYQNIQDEYNMNLLEEKINSLKNQNNINIL